MNDRSLVLVMTQGIGSYAVGNAAQAFGLRSMCGSDAVGSPMKSAIAAHLHDEHFVIRVDGRVKSRHRTFLGCS